MRDFILPLFLIGLVVVLFVLGTANTSPLALGLSMLCALPLASFTLGYAVHRWRASFVIVPRASTRQSSQRASLS